MTIAATWVILGLLGGAHAQDRIVGGVPAAEGDWPDVAALYSRGGTFVCTGVLVAPDVVLTAGHCNVGLHHVVLDTIDREEGEEIAISRVEAYPSSWVTYDVAVVILAEPSSVPPRVIASGCAVDAFLHDGASATIVGYGALDEQASEWSTQLMQATVPITDADCADLAKGCNELVSPGGELVAGGDGVDTCNGDSGGPLYLDTPYGPMLAGITSRATDDAVHTCGDGGIYARTDGVLSWIEAMTGETLPPPTCPWQPNHAPEPTVDALVVDENTPGHVAIDPGDPDSGDLHWFDVLTPPGHGVAEVTGNGVVRYRPDPGFDGEDHVVVTVRDSGYPQASATVEVPITVHDTVAGLTITRDGCDATGGGPWWVGLALVGLRRRR